MKNKKRLCTSSKISNITEIPFDMATRQPYIKMYSNREVTVEDAGKLLHYDGECVKIRQGKISIAVIGRDLKILCLANNDMRVTGYITSLNFE